MAWFKLPSPLCRLQNDTRAFKIAEGMVLFMITGTYSLSSHGWTTETQSWFAMSILAYPILWVTSWIVRISISLVTYTYRPFLMGRKTQKNASLFDNLPTLVFDSMINWHERLVTAIWHLPADSPKTEKTIITNNTLNIENHGIANLSNVQVGDISKNGPHSRNSQHRSQNRRRQG